MVVVHEVLSEWGASHGGGGGGGGEQQRMQAVREFCDTMFS